jgi:hypothetical protein
LHHHPLEPEVKNQHQPVLRSINYCKAVLSKLNSRIALPPKGKADKVTAELYTKLGLDQF